uniref:Putative Magnetosome protein MamN n=1 Tax=Magnetococcus massalia (strain MO-1) TaxID=451514 RepID=A0A1S7LHQ7_MAGMO
MVIFMVLITYTSSLMINNLAAMVVIVPITLNLCDRLKLNPIPLLILEIIASNLGGASTMVGDFPNMIITSAGDLSFTDFISGMMVPCLMMLAIMLLFLAWKQSREGIFLERAAHQEGQAASKIFSKTPEIDPYLAALGQNALWWSLIGFFAADFTEIRPAAIALLVGFLLLFLGRFSFEQFVQGSGIRDILYFLGLFVMIGGLNATGMMDGIANSILIFSADSQAVGLLLLLWLAWALTPFFNAGPATAFFIPIASDMAQSIPGEAVWWALSLGVLAGSSAALTGATSGPVVASFVQRFSPKVKGEARYQLDFMSYLGWGLPISLLFVCLSSLYILLIA